MKDKLYQCAYCLEKFNLSAWAYAICKDDHGIAIYFCSICLHEILHNQDRGVWDDMKEAVKKCS